MSTFIAFMTPYDFSPTVLAVCLLSAVLFVRGSLAMGPDEARPGIWRWLSFFVGLIAIYVVMQTRIDYYSQHMFWVHRAQHLVLHHTGPFLLMLAAPQAAMARGLPHFAHRLLVPVWRSRVVQTAYRFLQHPIVAAGLFVGLIYFWLMPEIHFKAMLSLTRYQVMNWSMLLDGLLFWWLIVNPNARERGGLGFGWRILLLWAITMPQIVLGAYIALHHSILYDVYNVCGRAWPISPLVDQEIGGLITWIPTSMMSVIAAVVVLRMWLRDSARRRSPSAALVKSELA